MTRATDWSCAERATPRRPLRRRLMPRAAVFRRDEDGSLIVFSLFIFVLMLIIGGLAVDLMRFETTRTKLQNTVDRAALAAAALNQELDPATVVGDYFERSGMSQFVNSVTVSEAINFRMVDIDADVNVPTHFFSMVGIENLGSPADSIAQESIGDVEISLVLDVSGSMNSYSRLTNLKAAAKDFVDTVYDASEDDAVSTAIVPYATQVNAGAALFPYLNVESDGSHDISHCINFTSSDFDSASIYDHLHTDINPISTPMEQTLHFDPWTDEHDSFDLGEYNDPYDFYPVCPNQSHREIMVWSTDKTDLKNYIDGLTATGNTSTDIGTKWGAALLDPAMQPVLSGLVGSGDVDAAIDGRPYNYNSNASMKILVVMTDGAHTSQYYMGDHRSGDSFVWRYVDNNGVVHYSIWWDGAGSTPNTSPDPDQKYNFCDDWDWGTCADWDFWYDPEWWFHARSYDGINNTYSWLSSPYDGNSSYSNVEATRMTWEEVWAEIPPEYFSDEVLYEMQSLSSNERNTYEWAIDSHGQSTKDGRFDDVCEAVKSNDVIVFTIGLEVTTSNATRLATCATSASHYYDVDNLDIDDAFQSIASQINQLRLIQ
ncbi:MAG: pilus assembly protein TadG-related protein [Rhodobacter sp.]|nr:pilus assembly protein TadG-related protein [Rhodobacter sp.]